MSAKYMSLFVLICQMVSIVLMMGYSKTVNNSGYISSSAVLTAEFVKFVLNFLIESFRNNMQDCAHQLYSKETAKLAIPAFLYVIQNNLTFLALSQLSVPMYQVTSQGKIFTTAVVSRLLLNKQISCMQYVSLLILAFGVAIVQFSSVSKSTGENKNLIEHSGNKDFLMGLLAVLICCLTSSFAGVYFEKLVKKEANLSVYMRNVQLSLWSILLGIVTICFNDLAKVKQKGFFHGYNRLVLAIILNQAIGGLTVSFVMKYADNILKGFATSVSIFVAAGFSVWLLGTKLDVIFFVGAFAVTVSVLLYAKFPPAGEESSSTAKEITKTCVHGLKRIPIKVFFMLLLLVCLVSSANMMEWHAELVKEDELSISHEKYKATCAIVFGSNRLLRYLDRFWIDSFDEVICVDFEKTDGYDADLGKRATLFVAQSNGTKWFAKQQNRSALRGLTFPMSEQEVEGYKFWHMQTTSNWTLVSHDFVKACRDSMGKDSYVCSPRMLTVLWALQHFEKVTIFGAQSCVLVPLLNTSTAKHWMSHPCTEQEYQQLKLLHLAGTLTVNWMENNNDQ